MRDLIRAEVTDKYGTVAEFADLDQLRALPTRKRRQLDALAASLVGSLASLLGTDEDHARKVAVADLIRLVADQRAYERECERRGVLPL